jgi:hypothetical protein
MVFNRMPNLENGLSPNDLWSSCQSPTEEFDRAHVFGCPVYVLEAALQDGHKIPKWAPRACLGIFLGFSTLHSSQVPIVMNVDTGKISPQFHIIFDDKFETVVSMSSEDSLGDQWKAIFCLGCECYEDVDYNENGNAILPPLTSLFKPDNSDDEITPTSPWMAPTNTSHLVSEGAPVGETLGNNKANIVPEGAAQDTQSTTPGDPINVTPEGDVSHSNSIPEGATLDSSTPLFLDNIADNELSDTGQPRWNVGNYKQGPAIIRRLPIKGEQYDFSFSVISDWEKPISVSTNRAQAQINYHPKQRVHNFFLAECYLLQDSWINDLDCLYHIYSNVILDSWESNEVYITEIIDPQLLAARSSASKHNKDNPLWDTAMKGPFQVEFWQAMRVELNTLTNEFKCWDLVPRLPHMNILPSTWAFKIKRFPDGTVKKFKAHFCARGDRQKEGIDFFQTWAPVVQWSTIRIVMVLAATLGLHSVQCDIIAAFIHGRIPPEEEIYVHQPHGFKRGDGTEVLQLKRTLYGLRQSPRYFFKYFTECLVRQGLAPSNFDPCLFMSTTMIVIIYVDDILIYCKSEGEINNFIL